jgi:cbb3-type cytochrome oxidase subunit 3
MNRKYTFFIIFLVVCVYSLFSGPRRDSYEYTDVIFPLNIAREEALLKLNDLAYEVIDYGDKIYIELRMAPLRAKNYDKEDYTPRFIRVPYQRYADGVFEYEFIINSGMILLKKMSYRIVPWNVYNPKEKEPYAAIFFQSIVKYLNGNSQINFINSEEKYVHDLFDKNQILRADVFYYTPHYSYWFEPVSLTIEYNIEKSLIDKLFQFDWVLNKISFPDDYYWYRYPEYEIGFQYLLSEEEILEIKNKIREDYEKKNEDWSEAVSGEEGIRNFFVNIWRNNDQYFGQISSNNEYYMIDIEKLKSVFENVDKVVF